MRYNLNSGLNQDANSNAISLCAYVHHPYLHALDIIHIASVASIHFLGVKLNVFNPTCFLKVSNSLPLNFGLYFNRNEAECSWRVGLLVFGVLVMMGSRVWDGKYVYLWNYNKFFIKITHYVNRLLLNAEYSSFYLFHKLIIRQEIHDTLSLMWILLLINDLYFL